MTHALSVRSQPTNGTIHRNIFKDSNLNDRSTYGDLVEAAHSYARAVQAVREATETVQSSATALVLSDIEAIDAVNVEWEAKATLTQGPRNEAGFTAEVTPRTTGDLEVLNRATEMASLRYQECRALSMRAEVRADEATRTAEAAKRGLLQIARRFDVHCDSANRLVDMKGALI
jgi:hypothetical protein